MKNIFVKVIITSEFTNRLRKRIGQIKYLFVAELKKIDQSSKTSKHLKHRRCMNIRNRIAPAQTARWKTILVFTDPFEMERRISVDGPQSAELTIPVIFSGFERSKWRRSLAEMIGFEHLK